MSEICVDCLTKVMDVTDIRKKYIITRTPDLCEECGQYKRVIIRCKMRYILADRFRELTENLRYLRNR